MCRPASRALVNDRQVYGWPFLEIAFTPAVRAAQEFCFGRAQHIPPQPERDSRTVDETQDTTLWVDDLTVRWEYDNQNGNRRIDLNGLQSVSIALSQPGQKAELNVLVMEMLP